MGRLYRRTAGGAWWGDWQAPDGTRCRGSLRTSDIKVARARLRQAELASTDPTSYRSPQGLSEALDHMIHVASADKSDATRSFYEQKARHLVRIIGDVDIATIERGDVTAYIHRRIAEGASPQTVQKELVTLRRALKAAHEASPLPTSPADVMPKFSPRYTPKTRHLSEPEFGRLMEKCPAGRKLWLMVAVYTGAELGAMDRLEWRHINVKAGTILIPGTKRESRQRPVPIAAPLLPWLLAALKRKPTGLVFGVWLNVRRELDRYCTKARVTKVTPNDLRRTYASWMKQAGVDSRTVADLLGHSSTKMVDLVYGKLTPQIYANAVATLPACDAGVPDVGPLVARSGAGGTVGRLKKSVRTQDPRCPVPESNQGHADFQSAPRFPKLKLVSRG